VQTFLQILGLGRRRVGSFVVVALMVSFGTVATLCEPWIYRAIIDDIAGVFVPPRPVMKVESAVENAVRSVEHWSGALDRIFSVPMEPFDGTDAARRTLESKRPREAAATIILGAMLLVVIRLVAEGFKRLADNRATLLATELEQDFIIRTFTHVIHLPLGFFSKRASGSVARQIDQSDNVAPIFTAVAKELWPDLFRLLAILAIMLTVNYELALVATLTVVLYGAISWRLAGTIERDAERYYGLWDEVASRVQQAIAGIKTVRAHGTESYEAARVQDAAHEAYSTYRHRTRIENRYSYLQDCVISVSKACVLAVGGLKAIEHQLTPGDVVMFLAYLDRLFAPIEGLTGLYTTLQHHVVGVRRAHRLLEEPSGGDDGLPPLRVNGGHVRFENVCFAYNSNHPVLEDVSFELKAGQRTALIGPSGAGKTTVADLLVALHRPQRGEIFIDDQKLSRLSPPSIRSAVRTVATDGTIFRTSIRDNIRYGRADASDDAICEAARLAGLGPVIERLSDGLDTIVGEQGVELSLGERQRILVARAFVASPSILILDEATANLDFRTEASIKRALEVVSRDRTTLIVAHRRSMLTCVDRVLVLRDGRIEQDGTPADLMNQTGYFRDMMAASDG
jgi:ATP-binding cassette, subfamily B, bacterial